ncbi:hypothetical protein GCM10023091_16410 [Ravibacter arvi]|uniref:Rad50/SbcC-type AAA domain-containing protein n=1 Tax=Ravibacter arvi TaxID=2051041 RepID=A0ABP8LVV6_9BACT
MKKFILPTIEKVEIKNFSLYKKVDLIEIDLTKEVYCLAGANGLGKSTFITIINYCLTGIVKNPSRKFTWYNEIPKFYNQSKGFASIYFDGRISEENYESAEVSIEFLIGLNRYRITRGFFEPDQLRSFSKLDESTGEIINFNEIELDLNEVYKEHFTKDIQLSQFDQFVFIQTFVLTFDETHQLLFWDESLIERVLYLFFGVDSEKAKLADKHRKEYNKFDSTFRNLQWQITKTRNELNNILKSISHDSDLDPNELKLYEEHKSLSEEVDEIDKVIDRLMLEIKDCDLAISDFLLKSSTLRGEYEILFSNSLTEEVPLEKNTEIIKILYDLKVRIYSSKNYEDLIQDLINALTKLKNQESENKSNDEYFKKLSKIDSELSSFSKEITSIQNRKTRLLEEQTEKLEKSKYINDRIREIERENENEIRKISRIRKTVDYSELTRSYEEQIARYTTQKDESSYKRSLARKELQKLEKDLNQGYINAESIFIPIFNDYARSFLGLDVSIELSASTKGTNLSLHIEDSRRQDSFKLSESQRYFIDIALRMALIELGTESATFLIDTPEGSLDIAYESRAGKMLADFAKEKHKLIMTANINSSQLLLELASICRGDKMKIERMTNWTILSEVQQQEVERIEEAYTLIESKLQSI